MSVYCFPSGKYSVKLCYVRHYGDRGVNLCWPNSSIGQHSGLARFLPVLETPFEVGQDDIPVNSSVYIVLKYLQYDNNNRTVSVEAAVFYWFGSLDMMNKRGHTHSYKPPSHPHLFCWLPLNRFKNIILQISTGI